MQISNSEKLLMDVLWQNASARRPVTAKQIIQQIDENLQWHDKTVKSLLNRLLKKQAIDFKKNGREYLYYPILREDDYVEIASDSFLKRVFNGSVSSLVASFAKQEKISDSDLAELKSLIQKMEGERGSDND